MGAKTKFVPKAQRGCELIWFVWENIYFNKQTDKHTILNTLKNIIQLIQPRSNLLKIFRFSDIFDTTLQKKFYQNKGKIADIHWKVVFLKRTTSYFQRCSLSMPKFSMLSQHKEAEANGILAELVGRIPVTQFYILNMNKFKKWLKLLQKIISFIFI